MQSQANVTSANGRDSLLLVISTPSPFAYWYLTHSLVASAPFSARYHRYRLRSLPRANRGRLRKNQTILLYRSFADGLISLTATFPLYRRERPRPALGFYSRKRIYVGNTTCKKQDWLNASHMFLVWTRRIFELGMRKKRQVVLDRKSRSCCNGLAMYVLIHSFFFSLVGLSWTFRRQPTVLLVH